MIDNNSSNSVSIDGTDKITCHKGGEFIRGLIFARTINRVYHVLTLRVFKFGVIYFFSGMFLVPRTLIPDDEKDIHCFLKSAETIFRRHSRGNQRAIFFNFPNLHIKCVVLGKIELLITKPCSS